MCINFYSFWLKVNGNSTENLLWKHLHTPQTHRTHIHKPNSFTYTSVPNDFSLVLASFLIKCIYLFRNRQSISIKPTVILKALYTNGFLLGIRTQNADQEGAFFKCTIYNKQNLHTHTHTHHIYLGFNNEIHTKKGLSLNN